MTDMENTKEQLLRPSEVENMLRFCRRTLRRYEQSGKLTPVKLNCRVTRYRRSEVLALMGGE